MARGKRNRSQEQASLTTPRSPKTEYPASAMDWEQLPDGLVALVAYVPNKVLLFPMTQEYAEQLNQRRLDKTIAPTAGGAPQEDHDAAAA